MIWLTLLKSNWRLITILAVSAALVTYIETLRIQRDHARTKAENIQTAFDQFQAKVRVEGEAAKLRVAEEVAQSERAKNETVATLQSRLDALARDRDRLRNTRTSSGGSVLPAIPAGAPAAHQRAEFDRTVLDDALRSFVEETSGLAIEGDAAIAIRDGWHNWYDGQVRAEK